MSHHAHPELLLSKSANSAVLVNDVTDFTAIPGLAQIVLDGSLLGSPDTSQSTVVCKSGMILS